MIKKTIISIIFLFLTGDYLAGSSKVANNQHEDMLILWYPFGQYELNVNERKRFLNLWSKRQKIAKTDNESIKHRAVFLAINFQRQTNSGSFETTESIAIDERDFSIQGFVFPEVTTKEIKQLNIELIKKLPRDDPRGKALLGKIENGEPL